MNKKIVILGSGVSGLTAGYWLKKNNIPFQILEKNSKPGGVVESYSHDGYLFDKGPNSALETTPIIKQIVDDVGLADEMIYANQKGNKRYILRNGMLNTLEMKPIPFLKSKLLSMNAKLRIAKEPFIAKGETDGYYESLADFVNRRFGKEFQEYVINPFVAGVFAGNPEELSVKSAFPKLYALEEKYGGVIKGAIKSAKERKRSAETSKQSAKMFSFKSGMEVFPRKIVEFIGSENISYDCSIQAVTKEGSGYKIVYAQGEVIKELTADIVISAMPSYAAEKVFSVIDPELARHLDSIYYPPVIVLYLSYKKSAIQQPLDGFGFLIPKKEKKAFLGAIWSSVLFPERASDDKASFTLFIGGARRPEIADMDREILFKEVIAEFQDIMRISDKPVFNAHKYWAKAIPQYNIGYIEHENYFNKFEEENKGIILSGNYRGGISFGDCVKNSEIVFNKVKSLL